MTEFSWIRAEVQRLFPRADLTKGVDLDGNGTLEDNEKITDADNNGVVGNHADWEAFRKRNSTKLSQLPGIFKYGSFLKPGNPIHDIMATESPMVRQQDVQRVYETIRQVLASVRAKFMRPLSPIDAIAYGTSLEKPEGKIREVFKALENMRIARKAGGLNTLLSDNLKANFVDCDTSAFIVLAVGYEMNWPVHLVLMPNHAIVRWDDGKGIKVNYDQVEKKSDADYIKKYNIHPTAVKQGAHLANLSRANLIGYAHVNRSWKKRLQKDSQGALRDLELASKLAPKLPCALYNYGAVLYFQNKSREALSVLNTLIQLDPNHANGLFVRGHVKKELGDTNGSDADYAKAKALDPDIERKSTLTN